MKLPQRINFVQIYNEERLVIKFTALKIMIMYPIDRYNSITSLKTYADRWQHDEMAIYVKKQLNFFTIELETIN